MSLGIVIGSFSIAYIISAIVSGKYLSKIGKGFGLKLGLFMVIIQLFGLGSLKLIQSPSLFVGLSILFMAIGGSGAALNVTCALAVINTNYPDDKEQNLGLFEGGSGLGLLIGPLLGSLLYSIGGYCVPFFTFGLISLILFPEIQKNLKELNKRVRKRKAVEIQDSNDQEVEIYEPSNSSTKGSN